MHITEIETKDGKKYSGYLEIFSPEKSFLAITTYTDNVPHYREFPIGELKSAVTKNVQLSISSIGDEDLLIKAHWFLSEGRKNNWPETPKEKFNWEK